MSSTVSVRVLRPINMAGERVEAGIVLQLPALAAADALRSGRVHLVYPDDAVAVLQAERAATKAQLKAAGGSNLQAPPKDWPWESRGSVPLS
jgi:hypothetical protein